VRYGAFRVVDVDVVVIVIMFTLAAKAKDDRQGSQPTRRRRSSARVRAARPEHGRGRGGLTSAAISAVSLHRVHRLNHHCACPVRAVMVRD
jgi:hypothetical protein